MLQLRRAGSAEEKVALGQLGLRSVFLRVLKTDRKGGGLGGRSYAELLRDAKRDDWTAVAKCQFFRELAALAKEPREVVVERYLFTVAERMPEQARLVIDLTLALGLDRPHTTYDRSLMARRRRAQVLLRGMVTTRPTFTSIPDAGSSYIKSVEDPALEMFAAALDEPQPRDLQALGLDQMAIRSLVMDSPTSQPTSRPKAVVLGASAMDFGFSIPRLPGESESVQAHGHWEFPGGKGLTQAIACARLGIDTSLISVVGGDDDGQQICAYLEAQGVRTDLIDLRAGKRSAVVAVLTPDGGGSMAIAWNNEQSLFLHPDRLSDASCKRALDECDYLLTSFALPARTVESALIAVKTRDGPPATTIVEPAPPYEGPILDPMCHQHIDYLAGNRWELEHFARPVLRSTGEQTDVSLVADAIMSANGVKNLLAIDDQRQRCYAFVRDGGRTAQTDSFSIEVVPTRHLGKAGAQSAFCAMLALQLHFRELRPELAIRDVVLWATTAMTCGGERWPVPESMPDLARVTELVAQRRKVAELQAEV